MHKTGPDCQYHGGGLWRQKEVGLRIRNTCPCTGCLDIVRVVENEHQGSGGSWLRADKFTAVSAPVHCAIRPLSASQDMAALTLHILGRVILLDQNAANPFLDQNPSPAPFTELNPGYLCTS